MTTKEETLIEKQEELSGQINLIANRLQTFMDQQNIVNARLLNAVEGNGRVGLKDRMLTLEMECKQRQLIGSRETTHTDQLITDFKELSCVSEGKQAQIIVKIANSIKNIEDKLLEHLNPDNAEHNTLAKLFKTKPVQAVSITLGCIVILVAGIETGFFTNILPILKKLVIP